MCDISMFKYIIYYIWQICLCTFLYLYSFNVPILFSSTKNISSHTNNWSYDQLFNFLEYVNKMVKVKFTGTKTFNVVYYHDVLLYIYQLINFVFMIFLVLEILFPFKLSMSTHCVSPLSHYTYHSLTLACMTLIQ